MTDPSFNGKKKYSCCRLIILIKWIKTDVTFTCQGVVIIDTDLIFKCHLSSPRPKIVLKNPPTTTTSIPRTFEKLATGVDASVLLTQYTAFLYCMCFGVCVVLVLHRFFVCSILLFAAFCCCMCFACLWLCIVYVFATFSRYLLRVCPFRPPYLCNLCRKLIFPIPFSVYCSRWPWLPLQTRWLSSTSERNRL